jgi:hypothetical protein
MPLKSFSVRPFRGNHYLLVSPLGLNNGHHTPLTRTGEHMHRIILTETHGRGDSTVWGRLAHNSSSPDAGTF